MKKAFSILSVMILLSILIYSAALGEVYGDWEYSSSDGKTCTINKYNGSEAEVTVPSVLNGYEVTSIGSKTFYNCSSLVNIEIPDSVKSVGASTFEGCSNLESVKMPKGETFLRSSLFKNCSSLKSVELPDDITQVGDSVFSGCPVHKRFCSIASETAYALSKTDYSFVDKAYEKLYLRYEYDEDKKEIIGFKVSFAEEDISEVKIPDGITSIGSYAFDNCKNVSSIDLPNSITVVGEGAFTGCNCKRYCDIGSSTAYALSEVGYSFTDKEFDKLSLKYEYDKNKEEFCGLKVVDADEDIREAKIPESVTSIGDAAFYNCSSLTSIVIPESVTSIGGSAFHNCSRLMSIEIPESVRNIGSYAFYNCSSLMSIKVPSSVTSIENHTFFGCSSLKSIEIPGSVMSIGSYAFQNCSDLMSVVIPEGVTSVCDRAFYNCSALTSIEMPKSVTSIGGGAFRECSNLRTIEIPEGVTNIGNGAFRDCSHLRNIEIPGSVTNIGSYTFQDCGDLMSVMILEGVTSIGSYAFRNCSSLTSIVIPESMTSIGSYAFYNCSTLSDIKIPESVTSLRDYTFANCRNLIEADLPDGITIVEKGVFSGCDARRYCSIGSDTAYALSKARYSFRDRENEKLSLRYEYEQDEITGLRVISADEDIIEAKIPESVTSIGESAFSDCSSLTSIEISDSVTNIESFAFEGCSSLTSIEIPASVTSIGEYIFNNCSSLTSVEIPEGVTSIENFTFWNCSSLASIEIPGSVTSIGYSAFRDCRSLASIVIPGNVTSIGSYAFYNCSSLTSVEIPESVTSIGNHAFNNCGLQTIIIPEGVCSIGDAALQCVSLKKVFLPKSVREIDGSPILKSTTVYCYKSSYAESWARDNGYTVVLIDEKPFSEIGSIDVKNKIYVANGVNTQVKADIFPLLPEIIVNWTSSDPEIFTVKDGVITGRKNGTATLTITAGGLSAKSEVTVVTVAEDFTLEDIYVPAKGIAEAIVTGIVPADATLDIEWSTEDSVIASVTEEGLVTGKVLGETTLTAVDRVTGRKRTATVYIIGPIKRVELDRISAELLPFEGLQLNATAYTDERSFMNQQLTFASNNEAVAVVNQRGFVQAKGAGTATITATAGSRAKASCQITVREAAIMLIPASAAEIAAGAFEGTGAELYVIPETTKIIGARAFADMKKARVIVLPEGVEADPTAFDGTDATFIRPDGTAVQ